MTAACWVHRRVRCSWPRRLALVPPAPRRLPCLCATLMRCQAEEDAVVRGMRRREIGATTARRRGYVVQHAELLWQPSIFCACGRGRERDVFVCKGALYELLQTNALLRC